MANQGRRGVVRARGAALLRRHDAFEDSAEHVGSDTAPLTLGDGEMKALEETVEGVAPQGVLDVAPNPALEWMRLEQAAVEEGNRAEGERRSAPLGDGTVESAEKQRPEQISMDSPASGEAPVHRLG